METWNFNLYSQIDVYKHNYWHLMLQPTAYYLYAPTHFTKHTAGCLTLHKAQDCLDQQASMWFGQNMHFLLGSGIIGWPDPQSSVSITGSNVRNENKSPELSRQSASPSPESCTDSLADIWSIYKLENAI